VITDLRCCARAWERGDESTGSAPAAATHALVELPLPWPSKVESTAVVSALTEALGGDAKVKAVVPDEWRPSPPGQTRVILHRAEDAEFRGYARTSISVPTTELAEGGASLREALAAASPASGVDVLVCTHGSRDRCCGSLGTSLAARLRLGEAATVWRSSHLGGHRFAPTALLLPSGTAWAWLDDELLAAILHRTMEPAALRRHYRGTTAFGHPAVQLLEAEAFAAVGWSWLDGPRTGRVVVELGPGAEWAVEVTGAGGAWEGVVRKVGEVPQPVCGQPDEASVKQDAIYELSDVARRPAPGAAR